MNLKMVAQVIMTLNRKTMSNRKRISVLLIRQLVLGVAYLNGVVFIGILCFNIQIECSDDEMEWFQFVNLLKQ